MPRTPFARALFAAVAVLMLALATLTVSQTASATPPSPPFTLRPGTNQLEVLGADAQTPVDLQLVHHGVVVGTGTTDAQGSFEWRLLPSGTYTVRTTSGAPYVSPPVKVTWFGSPPPAQSFYSSQSLHDGFNFITTRDGTTLSANVVLPKNAGPGPYPTVVEYSGYDPSNPRETTFPQLFNTLGYAYVGVNVRGTGCSGGSFLPFEPVQSLDGYDAIEAIAAQPWVKFHKVGMVGISYPGIEQLYVARTRPPHLSAITPLSVIDDTYRGTLWPGGILNTGFATPWATARAHDAQPYGEGWEHSPDPANPGPNPTCDANQLVRDQNPDPVSTIEDNPFYNKTYYRRIDPTRFVRRINVPVYIAGAWQDEQTGGHFPDFLNRFRSAPHVFATMSNGSHTESLSLGEFGRYADFLDLYVARRVPTGIDALVAPVLAKSITGIPNLSLPQGQRLQRPDLCAGQAPLQLRATGPDPLRGGRGEGRAVRRPAAAVREVVLVVADPERQDDPLLPASARPAGLDADEAREAVPAVVLGRPQGAPGDRLLRLQQRDLGRPPGVPLGADPEGHRPRLDHHAAEEEPRDHRQRLAERLGEVVDARRGPRGDHQRRAPQRT